MRHTRGKPYHPMTQGKIELWHLSLKSRILLENYYLPGDLERAIADFVEHYNHRRYHESLDNLTPADVYFGRGQRILERQNHIKRRTIEQRRQQHFNAEACPSTRWVETSFSSAAQASRNPDDGQLRRSERLHLGNQRAPLRLSHS
jgi:hypothetical protein